MLQLKDIVKEYPTGETKVKALKGISVAFRKNEFVSVLGPSGCGKTTLLNLIGGLDQYTTGDLIIRGRSTRHYKDRDWDTYRNNSVGFVFQSYNLIPHQSVLANVELALTLSGVSREERRRRAMDVLRRVGLEDQMHKKPNQMSGGQMQRVAIARALVNNPDILLADEPTGALDSATSVQVMEILKEVAKDRLVIMVTHNPELAEKYSTRIVRLKDGQIVEDTDPFPLEEEEKEDRGEKEEAPSRRRHRRGSMSPVTALSLSLNNLMTKKGRTFLTAFAGSIGIIGIALILSISNGVQQYIDKVEKDTLSSYPVSIQKRSVDTSALLSSLMETQTKETDHDLDKVYSSDVMGDMFNMMNADAKINNLKGFKEFLEENDEIDEYASDIQYGYDLDLQVFASDTSDGVIQVNPSTVLDKMGMGSMAGMSDMMASSMGATSGSKVDVFEELMDSQALRDTQYDLIAGKWPESANETVLIVDENNEVSDYTLYALGLKDQDELEGMFEKIEDGQELEQTQESYSYDDILNLTFRLVLNTDLYEKGDDGWWRSVMDDEQALKEKVDAGMELQVVGIIRVDPEQSNGTETGGIGYTQALTRQVIESINQSDIVKEQKENPDIDVFTGLPFDGTEEAEARKAEQENAAPTYDLSSLPAEQQAYLSTLSPEELASVMEQYGIKPEEKESVISSSTYEKNVELLGVCDLESPSSIQIFPKDFEAKESICDLITQYNETKENEEDKIDYTDYIGLMMSSVTTIVNMITYVLIAFVAISLIVSSIMIGIITYISVLERTKEIGILRSIGASKKDISRVFNAETIIEGFVAGVLGIGITLLLCIPVNMVVESLAGVSGIASLPWLGAVILVAISMALTVIAGLIPSKMAAKKDPVVALRTE